ncbi:uncharacterized protein LOC142587508 [Dermacentor variabilis]|uniref:uncharacterized protein LOC142587508 n=1 Tax=Dermacentor variabilis TaxID=34621 RepID=UPI003F5B819D
MVTLLGSRHVRIGKVPNLSLCRVRLCARHLPSSRGDICAGCLSLRVQNSARCGIEEVVLCLGARMRLDTDSLLALNGCSTVYARSELAHEASCCCAGAEKRSAACNGSISLKLLQYCSSQGSKKVWWKLLPRFRPEKTASIKGYTPLISTTGNEQHIERPRLKLALSWKLVLHNFVAALCCTACGDKVS